MPLLNNVLRPVAPLSTTAISNRLKTIRPLSMVESSRSRAGYVNGEICSQMTIFDEVLQYIATPAPAHFESLALKVFAYQFAAVPAYRAFCLGINVNASTVDELAKIPAVSTAAFKFARLQSGLPERVFCSSGTSRGAQQRSAHFVPRLDVYRASALAHLRRMLFPDGVRMRMLAMHPTADLMPESSLSQMISWCLEEFGKPPILCAATPRGVDLAGARRFLKAAVHDRAPVCILGTTAALGVLLEDLRRRRDVLALPVGSRIMDTGGAKGQVRPLTVAELLELCRRWLGVEPDFVINEYGMTEMCSQLYDATALNSDLRPSFGQRLKVAPPWLHVSAVDPLRLRPVDDGKPGLLRFFDLANVGSVCALLTEDVGIIRGGLVQVLGRAALSEARGCALGIAQFAELTRPSDRPGR
jgi:hypothetical protein